MEFTTNFIDTRPMTSQKKLPCDVIQWKNASTWLVLGKPFDLLDLPLENQSSQYENLWSPCSASEYVRVPMFPYLTDSDPAKALGFVFQLGFSISRFIPSSLLSRCRSLHLAVGMPIESVIFPPTDESNPNGVMKFRIWLGVGASGYK